MYHEARGEPYKGQLAVAYVVLNRAQHRSQSPCFIVYEPGQFTDINKVPVDVHSTEWTQAKSVAEDAIFHLKPDPTHGAEYFYAPAKVPKPHWAFFHKLYAVIANHRFYK